MTGQVDRLRRLGSQAVFTMPAEIDAINADEIRHALTSAANHDATVLVIDMTETTFCDSAGVQAIVAAYRQAATTGTRLRLAATAALPILRLVGVDQLIPVYPTLEAALAGEEY